MQQLKQQARITSQFLRVQNPGTASLGSGTKISPEIAVRLWTGALLSQDLTKAWRILPELIHMAESQRPFSRGPLGGAAHSITFPRGSELREHKDGSRRAFYNLISEVTVIPSTTLYCSH